MGIYTDLAAEARELNPDIDGIEEQVEEKDDVRISRIEVKTEQAAKAIGKAVGHYTTIDAPKLAEREPETLERVGAIVAEELKRLLGCDENATVAVIGLGNRFITPDALGPRVVENTFVTRHITTYMPEQLMRPIRPVAAMAPGVLGVTGVETLEIVRALVEHVKPAAVIAIDSLASRRAARISTTVQIADTGISPGSGVGNERKGLNAESLGVPVIAVGVPTVVYASTITQDTISLIADETGLHGDEEKLLSLAEKVTGEHFGPMVVTPKDIDQIVRDMSSILAYGVNFALHTDYYGDIKALLS